MDKLEFIFKLPDKQHKCRFDKFDKYEAYFNDRI